jgi:predicted transcriptional regulator
LKEKNSNLVLFAITDDGYEKLSVTMAELRNYIAEQRSVVAKYREYYEPPKNNDVK